MQRSAQYRGLTLEYISVAARAEYDFSWAGDHHFLALHDIMIDRGEINVAGLPAVRDFDLRDKMTYTPAGHPFKGWAKTAGQRNNFTFLQFDPALLSEEAGHALNNEDVVPLIHFEDSQLLSTMRKLERVMAGNVDQPAIYVETLALLAAIEVGQLQSRGSISAGRTGQLSLTHERILRDYIEENLAGDIALDELSQLVKLSRFHLSRRFKATFGMAPHRYIIERRLNEAKRLLKQSELSVAAIAAATGFSSAGRFIRTFKLATGLTPRVFRRT